MRSHPHLHLRQRISGSLEPYPARTAWKRLLDKSLYVVGIVGPIMTIPQIALIYSTHDAAGVAPLTWLSWALLDIPWILYGVVHREWQIVITYVLWFTANMLVVVGALLYG